MNVSDLMIDDWICLDGDVDYSAPIQVQQIICREHGHQVVADYDVFDCEDVHPIPLNQEILVKNGFEFQRHEFKTTNDDYWISDDKRIIFRGEHMTNSFNKWSVHVDTKDMRTMAYLEITYVHELQHLMRLCGIEKEIKIM